MLGTECVSVSQTTSSSHLLNKHAFSFQCFKHHEVAQ